MVPFYILCCQPSTKNSACLINIQNMWVIVQLDLKAEKFSDTFKVKVLHCRIAYKRLEQSSLISSGLRLHTTSVDEETPDSGTSFTDSCIWHTTKDLVEIRQWVYRTLSIQLLSSPFFPPMLREKLIHTCTGTERRKLVLITEVGNNIKLSCSVFLSYRRSVLSAAIKWPNAATVNQRLSWVFQELNLFFLFLEVKSPSVPRTPKEAAAAVIQGK